MFGSFVCVKYEILNNYVDRCYEANCVTCHIVAQR